MWRQRWRRCSTSPAGSAYCGFDEDCRDASGHREHRTGTSRYRQTRSLLDTYLVLRRRVVTSHFCGHPLVEISTHKGAPTRTVEQLTNVLLIRYWRNGCVD